MVRNCVIGSKIDDGKPEAHLPAELSRRILALYGAQ
jgi:hypothetical protein